MSEEITVKTFPPSNFRNVERSKKTKQKTNKDKKKKKSKGKRHALAFQRKPRKFYVLTLNSVHVLTNWKKSRFFFFAMSMFLVSNFFAV